MSSGIANACCLEQYPEGSQLQTERGRSVPPGASGEESAGPTGILDADGTDMPVVSAVRDRDDDASREHPRPTDFLATQPDIGLPLHETLRPNC